MQYHLRQRLSRHARERWPQVAAITVRFRAGFAYVTAELPSGLPSGSPEEALDCAGNLYLTAPAI